MLKLLIPLFVALTLTLWSTIVYCQTTETRVYKISVTIPDHVDFDTKNSTADFKLPTNTNQMVQTQRLIRNNRAVTMTSIVVP